MRNSAGIRVVTEMAFTAKPVSADRAERLGLINHVVPRERLESFTSELARDITALAPLGIAAINERLRILAGAHPARPQGFERIQGLRRVVYDGRDDSEGIRAFKARRPPVFKGE